MSPNVGNFVHDLVEMAKAMETLPQVQDELDRIKAQLETTRQAVQDRELAIIHYKSEIDDLHAKVRSLEVERDDASFRVLVAEDTAHSALVLVRTASVDLAIAIQKLDPPKPEPVKEDMVALGEEVALNYPNTPPQAQPVTTPAQEDTARPLDSSSTASGDGSIHGENSKPVPDAVHSISELPGQSESNPTNPATEQATSASSNDAKTSDADSIAELPYHGPYSGKRYIDVDGFISRYDWLRNGGTEADYDWRPAPSPRY